MIDPLKMGAAGQLLNLGSSNDKFKHDFLTIEHGLLLAGDLSYQLRNVASLAVVRVKRRGLILLCLLIGAFTGGIGVALTQAPAGFVIGLILGAIAAYFLLRNQFKDTHELKLVTNAATTFTVESDSRDFLMQMKAALEQEIAQKNPPVVHINVPEQRIEKVIDNRTFISTGGGDFVASHGTKVTAGGDYLGEGATKVGAGSSYIGRDAVSTGGGNYIGRDASNVAISSAVTQQASAAIAEVLTVLERSQDQNREFFVFHFQILQQFVEGQKSKGEAAKSFELIKEYAGVLSTIGINAAPLLARIAELFR
jgi:hypothetical protein